MEKELKTTFNIDEKVLSRDGEGSSLGNSERILSESQKFYASEIGRGKVEIFNKKNLNVWMVSSKTEQGDLVSQYSSGIAEHNNKARKQDEKDLRECRVDYMDYTDLKYGIEDGFGRFGDANEIPELIILKAQNNGRPASMTGIPNMIKKTVDKYVGDFLRYYNENIINTHLGENLYCFIASKFDFNKIEMNEDEIIEYGLGNSQMVQADRQQKLFEKYILTGEEKYITEFFSDSVLREIYKNMCTFNEEEVSRYTEDFWETVSDDVSGKGDEDSFFAQFRADIDHEANKKEWQVAQDELKKKGQEYGEEYDYEYEEVLAATDNYLDYRESIVSYGRSLDFKSLKGKMRETYVAMMKKELNAYAEEYFQDYDIFEAETKLLKPILVCVSEDPAQRELMRDYGTDVVLEKLSVEDMQQLVELVGRVKASAASLMPEKLKRIKKEFYKSVEDKLDARSEITADTEREIAFLEEIFRRHGNIKKVLDVGCGNGRIDLPLAEKGYEVLGLDANEQFLQSALKKSIEKNTPGVEFKKGDIIDYSDAVKPGTRDAVIYTWHTILEAFGPGNTLHSLGNAWSALRPGGVVVFDQPTRENPLMEDGWYGDNPDNEHRYLSYIMTEEEIEFILKMAGFEDVEIKKWQTKPSEEYPGGMCKLTISAIKPEIDMIAEGKIGMYRKLKEEQESLMAANRKRAEEDMAWVDEFDKRKSV